MQSKFVITDSVRREAAGEDDEVILADHLTLEGVSGVSDIELPLRSRDKVKSWGFQVSLLQVCVILE